MMRFRLFCSFDQTLTEILSDAEVLLTLHLAFAITSPTAVMSYGVEMVSMVCPVFSTGSDRERLADGFFGVLRDA